MPRRNTKPEPEPDAAVLAVPWDERKNELAAEALIAKSLAWHATARTLLNDCNIEELAAHIEAAESWLPGPTRLRRLIPIEVAPDIAARYAPAMQLWGADIHGVRVRRTPVETRTQVGVINGSEDWPTLRRLFGEDGATTDPDMWGAAH